MCKNSRLKPERSRQIKVVMEHSVAVSVNSADFHSSVIIHFKTNCTLITPCPNRFPVCHQTQAVVQFHLACFDVSFRHCLPWHSNISCAIADLNTNACCFAVSAEEISIGCFAIKGNSKFRPVVFIVLRSLQRAVNQLNSKRPGRTNPFTNNGADRNNR